MSCVIGVRPFRTSEGSARGQPATQKTPKVTQGSLRIGARAMSRSQQCARTDVMFSIFCFLLRELVCQGKWFLCVFAVPVPRSGRRTIPGESTLRPSYPFINCPLCPNAAEAAGNGTHEVCVCNSMASESACIVTVYELSLCFVVVMIFSLSLVATQL